MGMSNNQLNLESFDVCIFCYRFNDVKITSLKYKYALT